MNRGFTVGESSDAAEVVFTAHGPFDDVAFLELRDLLISVPESARVRVELGAVTTVQDYALGLLVHWLAEAWRHPIRLAGLTSHQQRLLRYLWQGADELYATREDPGASETAQA